MARRVQPNGPCNLSINMEIGSFNSPFVSSLGFPSGLCLLAVDLLQRSQAVHDVGITLQGPIS
jgi:hypothetical protein